MTTITITSDHPEAAQLVRKALENYGVYAQAHAGQCRSRKLHPGETREQLDRRAEALDGRAQAVITMAQQIPGGQAGSATTTRSNTP